MILSQSVEMPLVQKISNTFKKLSGCLAGIICITQIKYQMVNNRLLIDNWQHSFFRLKILLNFLLIKPGCKVLPILWLRSYNCLWMATVMRKKSWAHNPSGKAIVSTAFLTGVLPNFRECFYNSMETQRTCFQFSLWKNENNLAMCTLIIKM